MHKLDVWLLQDNDAASRRQVTDHSCSHLLDHLLCEDVGTLLKVLGRPRRGLRGLPSWTHGSMRDLCTLHLGYLREFMFILRPFSFEPVLISVPCFISDASG